MEFNSLYFIQFLSISSCIYYIILYYLNRINSNNTYYRNIYLLVLSLFFYSVFNLQLTFLMILLSFLVFLLGSKIQKAEEQNKKQFLILGLIASISWIFFFKLIPILSKFSDFNSLNIHYLLVPLGISYYSFKLISYLLEIYWERMEAEGNFMNFLLYVSFFPQLPSGPIQRPADFLEQVKQPIYLKNIYIIKGLQLIIFGFFKKLVVADRIGFFINPIYNSPDSYSTGFLLLAPYFYLIQLYCDFSGLTDISIGTAKLFGITAPENFNKPYLSLNIPDYWRRWHITLSEWLRDYLFMPLRMSLRDFEKSGLFISTMINMGIVGLWHGFSFSYLIYGLLQGFYIIISVYTLEFRDSLFEKLKISLWFRNFSARFFTLQLAVFSLLFFKIQNPISVVDYLQNIFKYNSNKNDDLFFQFYWKSAIITVIFYLILESIREKYLNVEDSQDHNKKYNFVELVFYSFLLIYIMFSGVFYGSTFIYNQF
jgi:alginate O-acetyltransferase complex protein AlgI